MLPTSNDASVNFFPDQTLVCTLVLIRPSWTDRPRLHVLSPISNWSGRHWTVKHWNIYLVGNYNVRRSRYRRSWHHGQKGFHKWQYHFSNLFEPHFLLSNSLLIWLMIFQLGSVKYWSNLVQTKAKIRKNWKSYFLLNPNHEPTCEPTKNPELWTSGFLVGSEVGSCHGLGLEENMRFNFS